MIWFLPNLSAWSFNIPYESLDFISVLLPRYWVIMITISMFFGWWIQKKSPSNGINRMAVTLILISTIGGMAAGGLIVTSSPNPTFLRFIYISFLMMFFGGFQMVIMGVSFSKIILTEKKGRI